MIRGLWNGVRIWPVEAALLTIALFIHVIV